MFYCIGLVAQALANILAFGLTKMEGIEGIRGWRWIFIVEGVVRVPSDLVDAWSYSDI